MNDAEFMQLLSAAHRAGVKKIGERLTQERKNCLRIMRARLIALNPDAASPEEKEHFAACPHCAKLVSRMSTGLVHPPIWTLLRWLAGMLEGEEAALVRAHMTKDNCRRCNQLAGSSKLAKDQLALGNYLRAAFARALEDSEKERDHGDLMYFNEVCRRGVSHNWSVLDPVQFLSAYHRCIAAAAKQAAVVEKNWDRQVALFRRHDAARIVADEDKIWEEWEQDKCYLSPRMVGAVITTAALIDRSWSSFKSEYLLLPGNPESESLEDWYPAHAALDYLPMVGEATAWYLIRNLYGAPVFKPDVHIWAIAHHFFPDAKSPLDSLSRAVRELWREICLDYRFLPVHLGEVDYIMWWYRQNTGLPETARIARSIGSETEGSSSHSPDSSETTLETISNLDEIVTNLHRLNTCLHDPQTQERAVSLIRRGHNLVACRCGGRWLFGPSRFAGYRDNTLENHEEFDGRHGWYTDAAISQVLGGKQPSEELEGAYQAFCRQHGVEPTRHQRFYWIIR
jgi:hypothetical protein